ncbi:hypothetical protein OHA77_18970 [Streptosporangium sp. NBC_01639]|uniref:hypothetical protein n=1 Tax=Streptosporangium sp. NBC_01639 TaxID=2975948 RepID=UPI0038638326|nr:hypothetical protein OHA77_18970 [Streptosporangium sp. NBC_01639]
MIALPGAAVMSSRATQGDPGRPRATQGDTGAKGETRVRVAPLASPDKDMMVRQCGA